MASVEWTFLLMNAFPGRAQTFVDNAISKIFPATSAEGFQTIASEESPNLPAALRIQWTSVGREEKMVLASRVMLLRFHVKLLVALILFMLLFGTKSLPHIRLTTIERSSTTTSLEKRKVLCQSSKTFFLSFIRRPTDQILSSIHQSPSFKLILFCFCCPL